MTPVLTILEHTFSFTITSLFKCWATNVQQWILLKMIFYQHTLGTTDHPAALIIFPIHGHWFLILITQKTLHVFSLTHMDMCYTPFRMWYLLELLQLKEVKVFKCLWRLPKKLFPLVGFLPKIWCPISNCPHETHHSDSGIIGVGYLQEAVVVLLMGMEDH